MKTNNKLIRKHKKDILEHFNPIEGGSQSEDRFAGFTKTSFTKTGFCTGAALPPCLHQLSTSHLPLGHRHLCQPLLVCRTGCMHGIRA